MEIIKNISFKEYYEKDGLSNSMLSEINKSPAHFKLSLESKKETEALTFGSLLHCLVLEPNNFERDYAIEPEVNKRTNDGKEILNQFYAENTNKTIITDEQLQNALKIKDNIMKHPIAGKLIRAKGDTEVSLFWYDKIDLKARPDKIMNDIIIDLKTTINASPEEFCRSAYKYGYHRQAYHYLNGYKNCYNREAKGFIFIVVEKEPPYAVCVYKASENFIQIGGIETEKAIDKFIECQTNNKWIAYDEILHELDVPEYVQYKYMED